MYKKCLPFICLVSLATAELTEETPTTQTEETPTTQTGEPGMVEGVTYGQWSANHAYGVSCVGHTFFQVGIITRTIFTQCMYSALQMCNQITCKLLQNFVAK